MTTQTEAAAAIPYLDLPAQIRAIRDELLFRAEVSAALPGSLPRYEFKAKRIHHKDTKGTKEEQRGNP